MGGSMSAYDEEIDAHVALYIGGHYIGAQGPHEGHTIRIAGRDGLFPDGARWLVRCDPCGTYWGVEEMHLREVVFRLVQP